MTDENKTELVSDCCGVLDTDTVKDGASFSDIGICPQCFCHCEFVESEE